MYAQGCAAQGGDFGAGGGACEFDCVFLVKQIFRLMVRLQVKQKTSKIQSSGLTLHAAAFLKARHDEFIHKTLTLHNHKLIQR